MNTEYYKTEVGDPIIRTLHFPCSRAQADLWLHVRQCGQKKKKVREFLRT